MEQQRVSSLPQPIAKCLQDFLDEDLPRSADELADLLVVVVEYIGAVALADYFNEDNKSKKSASNLNLNSWIVGQLALGKVEVGLWARWTQIAVKSTVEPTIPLLAQYVNENDLDNPNSNLSWLLRFRNDVMHGGFVAPLPKIIKAVQRMKELFLSLESVWKLTLIGCAKENTSAAWKKLSGLKPTHIESPLIIKTKSEKSDGVFLINHEKQLYLPLHPACIMDTHDNLHLQHNWKQQHQQWFNNSSTMRSFFERYQKEKLGHIDDQPWFQKQFEALPPQGVIRRVNLEEKLCSLIESKPGIISLVGPIGSGKSTLIYSISKHIDRKIKVYPIKDPSVRMDPAVLQRWIKKSIEAFGETEGLLVIDDGELLGQGLYTGISTQNSFELALKQGIPIIFIHTPMDQPPVRGDMFLYVTPWSADELEAWGDSQELLTQSGGHPEYLVNFEQGIFNFQRRLNKQIQEDKIAYLCLKALQHRKATCIELAEELKLFCPLVELELRKLLNWITEEKEQREEKIERVYSLHPATKVALEGIEL